MQRGKYDAAEPWLKKAASLATNDYEQAESRGKLGELAVKRGDLAQAAECLEEALQSLGQSIPRGLITRLFQAAYEILVQLLHSGLPLLLVHRKRCQPPTRQQLTIQLLSRLAYTYWFTHPRTASLWAHLRGMNLAERYQPSSDLAQIYAEHGPAMTLIPCFSRGISYVRRSLEIRRVMNDSWGQGQSLSYYSLVLYAASRFYECANKARDGIELLEKTGDYWQVHIARFLYSTALFRLGNLRQALAEAKLQYQSGVEVGDEQARAYALEVWARATHGALPGDLMERELERHSPRYVGDSPGPVRARLAAAWRRAAGRSCRTFPTGGRQRPSAGRAERLHVEPPALAGDLQTPAGRTVFGPRPAPAP